MLKRLKILPVFTLIIALASACGGSEEEAAVFFVSPKDGDTLTSPFKVEMGVSGMQIQPAGEVNEGFGHHHLIIDGSYIEEGVIVPADPTHIHYGKGQTVTDNIELSPGKHTLTLQFADGVHTSYGESMSKTIEITVE